MERDNRLLEGNIFSSLIRFALPFLAAALLQQLYGTVDTLAVGRLSADSAAGLSAISTGAQIIYMLTTLVLGLGTGGTVLIGQYVGADRKEEIRHTIGTMFPEFGIVGLVISVLLVTLAGPIVSLMQVPAEAVAGAKTYLIITGAGFLFVTGYNMVSGILRGLGDSKTPMILVAIACVINIILDIILVGPAQMGVAGAAVATIVAQGFSFICSLFILRRRKDYPLEFHWNFFRPRGQQAGLLLKLGAPIALQDFCIGLSFNLISAFVNRLGLSESACVGVSSRLATIAMLVASAFMSAIAAMAAQNMGNRKPERALSTMKWGMLVSAVVSIILCAIIEIWPGPLLGLFTSDQDVIAVGILYLRADALDIALVPFVFSMNGFFSGCGHSSFSMANNLISTFCIRVAGTLVITLIPGTTMFHIGLAAPAASLVQIVIEVIYLSTGRWRKNSVISSGEQRPDLPDR
ncbi:MAG: MATE family efflux transporter [Oscillospiraceae bacterium]|nr:MATE family efflux transporter [Oscillospiraceae bacterium]